MKQILGTDIPVFIAIIAGSIAAIVGGNAGIWVEMARSGFYRDLFFAATLGLINLVLGGITAVYTTPVVLAIVNKSLTVPAALIGKAVVVPEFLIPCLGFYCGSWGLNVLRWILRTGPKIEIDPVRVLKGLQKGNTNTESEHEKVSE